MLIGFDGSRAFISNKTGTENYSYQLLKALAKIEHSPLSSKVRAMHRFIIYIRPGVDVGVGWPDNFQFKQIRWPRFWTQAGLALQTFKDKLDVLFVPAHTLPLVRRPGLKTIITVHDLGSEYLPSTHQLKQRIYLGFMQRYQLNSVTKIIAVSQSTKEDLVKRIGINPEKIAVVYEGYDKEVFKPVSVRGPGRNILRHYGLKIGEYFLFVGTIQPRKNLARLIQAFSRFCHPERLANDSIKLVIAGSRGWLSDEIYKLPKRLGVENKVKFLGYVSIKVLPHLYSGAKALLFPSLFEGFGLPIVEAQACGCPVVTSNISSMPEIAGKGAIFVDPYDIDDIVKGMRQIEDRRLRMEKILAGFENIKRFSWEKCARETLVVLEETAS